MKKNGFTLAEVLITLTIIGVVAVLTLPALMANTAEQQARTALKKMTNTFTQAAAMNGAIQGFDYSGITVASKDGTSAPDGSLLRLILDRCNVDIPKKFAKPTTTNKTVDMAAYLQDGTAIYFLSTDTTATTAAMAPQNDGIMRGFQVIFDTNGTKQPNQVSNCVATTTGVTDFTGDDSGDCSQKTKRVIKDQYMMYLRGNYVAPLGAASAWILDDKQFKALTPGGGTTEQK